MCPRQKLRRFRILLAVPLALLLPSPPVTAAEPPEIRGPDVTIIEDTDRSILEYRQGGVLRMIRIVPTWGKPYYLVPENTATQEEDLERAEKLLPSWIIVEF